MHKRTRGIAGSACIVWGVALILGAAGRASADTLVTTAGVILHGSVRPTSDGYVVHTEDGQTTTVAVADVRQLLIDHAGPAPTVRSAAGHPPTTRPAIARPRGAQAAAPLVERGRTALAAGAFDAARTAFAAAIAADPANPTANRGLGYALLRLDDAAHAAPPLEVAARVTPGPPDRSLALALAAAEVAADNPVKAVKVLTTYLSTHASPPDEPMLNGLGVALSRASASSPNARLVHDGQDLYVRLNAALEATRPGERRWGTQWEPTQTVARQTSAWHAAQRQVAEDAARVAEFDNERQSAVNRAQSESGPLVYNNIWAQQNEARFDSRRAETLAGEEAAAQTRLDEAKQALATTGAPTFPPAIQTDDLDLTLGRAGSASGAGAAPTSASSAGTARAPVAP